VSAGADWPGGVGVSSVEKVLLVKAPVQDVGVLHHRITEERRGRT
jgi:hypothetical protein